MAQCFFLSLSLAEPRAAAVVVCLKAAVEITPDVLFLFLAVAPDLQPHEASRTSSQKVPRSETVAIPGILLIKRKPICGICRAHLI